MNSKEQFKQKIKAKVNSVISLADEKYGCKIAERGVDIKFIDSGLFAGRASMIDGRLELEFNLSAMHDPKGENHIIENTVPHEVAHLVNYVRPETGRNHNKGWKSVCLSLGGSSDRCHKLNLKRARKPKTKRRYEYEVGGLSLMIGPIRHNRIQSGRGNYLAAVDGKEIKLTGDYFTGRVVIF